MSFTEFQDLRARAREASNSPKQEVVPAVVVAEELVFGIKQEIKPAPKEAFNILELWEAEHSARSTLAVESSAKSMQPMLVKVKNGAAHMVMRVGDVLLYVETQVGEMSAPAKVWVLGKISSSQDSLKLRLEPLAQGATTYLSPLVAKVDGACLLAKAKVIHVALPIHARVVDGVLYVQGTVGNAKISVLARASQTWAAVADKSCSTYAKAYQAADARVRPAWVWSSSKLLSTKDAMLCTLQPYWTRAHDGSLYVQAVISDTLILVKVSANNRIVAPILLALARGHGAVNDYTAQLLARVVALYDLVKANSLHVLTPLLEKGKSMAAYTSTVLNGTALAVKVRLATIRDSAQARLSPVYTKFKNGIFYIRGVVGDKVVSIKISLTDLVYSLTAKASELGAGTRARVFTAKARIQDSAFSAAQPAKCKVGPLSSQIQVAVSDRSVQVTAMGAVGLATGSVIGSLCGVPAAFFTFGLSIPMGAAMGGATALCAGAVTGGAVGLVGGGASARTVHKHSDEIKGGAASALNKASGYKDMVSQKAKGCTNSVAATTMMMKTRIVGGTGGTVASEDSD